MTLKPSLLFFAAAASLLSGCTATSSGGAGAASAVGAADVTQRARVDAAVAKVYPALVRIHAVSEEGEEGRMQKQFSAGSGTIISEAGDILTNHHVAGRGTRFICRLADREEVPAKLVATDPLTDLAVIRLDLSKRRATTPLPVARFADSEKLRVGDVVLAMGSPSGLSQSVTQGIVANLEMISSRFSGGMNLDGESVGELVRWIGHDAVIYHGNSGGPLVNLDGEIVGVNEVGIGSLGGAIPANLAKQVSDSLIRHRTVARSWTGIVPQPVLKSFEGRRGILVGGVLEDSPASACGLAAGDVITAWNGVAVHADAPEQMSDYNRLVADTPVGSSVKIGYRRGDATREAVLRTAAREPNVGYESELPAWGVTARDFTRLLSLVYDVKDRRGVILDSVRSGSPAAEAKPALTPGDIVLEVGGRPVENLAALRAVTDGLLKGRTRAEPVLVSFLRSGNRLVTVVRPGFKDDAPPAVLPEKAWLGARTQVLTAEVAAALGQKGKSGVILTRVLPGTNAAEAGLRVGDIVTAIDGTAVAARRVEDDEVFPTMIRAYAPDTAVKLTVIREGRTVDVPVTLRVRPAEPVEYATYQDRFLEFTVRELAFNDRVEKRLDSAERGVLVSGVTPAGWAYLGGLQVGDVILSVEGKPVDTAEAVKTEMARLRAAKPRFVTILVRRGITTTFVELEPEWAVPGER